jgi:hypothetical protein
LRNSGLLGDGRLRVSILRLAGLGWSWSLTTRRLLARRYRRWFRLLRLLFEYAIVLCDIQQRFSFLC